jgi:hypothetical protein
MKATNRLAAATAVFIGAASVSMAHHGWSGYDSQTVLKLTGTIEQPSYANPHGTVRLKTEDKTWVVVLAPPSRMENRGLSKEMLKAGTQATVEGYPHREHQTEMRAERITIDGKTVELR